MSEEIQINVSGMTCNNCVQAVTKAVKSAPGGADADVKVDLDGGLVTVDGGNANRDDLVAAIADAGYEAQ